MNKYLWILLTTLLLASCSASDADEQAGGSAAAGVISYTVTADNATRGVIADTQEFLTDGRQFRVWSFMQKNGTGDWTPMTSDYNTTALQAVDVTYVAWRNEWISYAADGTTRETYYWPRPEYKVNFYAVYPNKNYFNTTNKTLDYTVPANQTDVDLMYATAQGQRDGTEKPNERKGVALNFHHALTQVSFYGKLSALLASFGWTVNINGITLCNIYSKGSLTPVPEKDGTVTEQPTQFINLEMPADYALAMNPSRQSLTTSTDEITLTSEEDVTMLLPQTLTAWKINTENTGSEKPVTTGSYLAVKMNIRDSKGYILGSETADVTVFAPFDCGVSGGWESGKHYRYSLLINGGYDALGKPVVKDLEITAAITPWTTKNVVVDDDIKR